MSIILENLIQSFFHFFLFFILQCEKLLQFFFFKRFLHHVKQEKENSRNIIVLFLRVPSSLSNFSSLWWCNLLRNAEQTKRAEKYVKNVYIFVVIS